MFAVNVFSVFVPLLVHSGISQLMVILANGRMDVTSVTSLTALVTLPIMIAMYQNDKKHFQKEKNAFPRWKGILISVICLGAGALLNWIWSNAMVQMHLLELYSNEVQENLLSGQAFIMLVGLGVLVPLTEEFVFRALIFNRLRRMIPESAAILLSVTLFSVYHGNIIQIIYALPMALILTLIYSRSRQLAYPVCFHVGANLLTIINTLM